MTGKRQWLDVEGLSLGGDDGVNKRFAACCAVNDTPADVVSCSDTSPPPCRDMRSLIVNVIPPSSAEPVSPRDTQLLPTQKPLIY